VVSLTTANGNVRVKIEKKRDVCREYDSGSGEHLIFSHSATMSESALILVSICCHTRSSCKHARERERQRNQRPRENTEKMGGGKEGGKEGGEGR